MLSDGVKAIIKLMERDPDNWTEGNFITHQKTKISLNKEKLLWLAPIWEYRSSHETDMFIKTSKEEAVALTKAWKVASEIRKGVYKRTQDAKIVQAVTEWSIGNGHMT